LAVQAGQDGEAPGRRVGEQVTGLGQAAELLDRLLEGVLRRRPWSLETSIDGSTSPSASDAAKRLRSSQCSMMTSSLIVRPSTPLSDP
jgi:hypothetical protein